MSYKNDINNVLIKYYIMIDKGTDNQGRPVTSSGSLVVTFFEGTKETQIQQILGQYGYEPLSQKIVGSGITELKAINRTYQVFVPDGKEDEVSLTLKRRYGSRIERIERPAMRYPTRR